MKVAAYEHFVHETDKTDSVRKLDVAFYGIAGELGSVISAVKRRLVSGDANWDTPNEEIIEELGDLIWYCVAAAHASNSINFIDVLTRNIANLHSKFNSGNEDAWGFGQTLGDEKRAAFLEAAATFLDAAQHMEFNGYQRVAFLTARTKGKHLAEVCLTVLSQHCAELLRVKLPDVERSFNECLEDRPVEDILGDIAWHIAAVASVYNLPLNDVIAANTKKVSRRFARGEPTPLYDEDIKFPETQRFPRRITVNFLSAPNGREQMYLDRHRLGEPLTDNARHDDGYRFHDVIHLAFVAKLGWSPVIRKLLGKKRKAVPKTDEVEDGARAQIMEEALINAIHAEGERQAKIRAPLDSSKNVRLFATRGEISFQLLKLVETFVRETEVAKSEYWEWEDAIYEGFAIFQKLREEGQGTVALDLTKRTIEYHPLAYIGLRGLVAALGSATTSATEPRIQERKNIIKLAVLDALAIPDANEQDHDLIDIDETNRSEIAVTTRGRVRQAMWDRAIVEFRVTVSQSEDGHLSCTAIGIGDAF